MIAQPFIHTKSFHMKIMAMNLLCSRYLFSILIIELPMMSDKYRYLY